VSSVVHLQHPLTGPALAETLDGGQCFRWRLTAGGAWHGVSGGLAGQIRPISPAALEATLPAGTAADLRFHLADDVDWYALADTLPHRTDAHLATCLAAFPGLRILRQPIGEALLCFLCSATKQIVQIKQMVALLAARHGRRLAPAHGHPFEDTSVPHPPGKCHPIDDTSRTDAGGPMAGPSGVADVVYALPTWAELATVPEKALRECLLGFRARHVAGVARFLAERPGWLEETATLPYAAAKARLIELPGVGEKIADCVLLFGAGRLEAFPVDVWILRVMAQRYGLDGWSPAQVAHFGRVHFGPLAGLAQQYLFAWERRAARTA
jgi:N-glycosylase/DNA lyase